MRDNLSFYERMDDGSPVSIVSIPLELGSDERGLAAAPRYLHDNGLEKMLRAIGREVPHKVSITCAKESRIASAGRMKHAGQIASVAKRSALAVEKAARRGEVVLALGGDHSIAIGSIAGAAAAYSKLGVIYIDAHPDCNTDETTITGNVHGMVTSTLLGHGHALLTGIPKRPIAPEEVLYVGIKDMDQSEIEFLREHSLSRFTMLDIATRGLSPVLAAIDSLARRVDAVWISMDMDSIDENDAPAVGLATKDGFTRREALALAHHIGKTCRVAGLDIVEMVPSKDIGAKTARLALELIARLLGSEYSWYQEHYIGTYRETNVTEEPRRLES